MRKENEPEPCKECRSYLPMPDTSPPGAVGYCRRYPPNVVYNLDGMTQQPFVLFNQHCDEFKRKDPP